MKSCCFKVILVLALFMGLLAAFLPPFAPQYIDYLIPFSRFFEAMLPVLAVGALFQYLCKGQCDSDHHH